MARRDLAAPAEVVVVGSVNVDLVVRVARLPAAGETVSGGTFERHGGGKGANAAIAAARAGASVRLIAAVGEDDDGGAQLRELEAEGIDTSGVARVRKEATGRALIVVAESGENQVAVASGANARLDAHQVTDALGRLVPADDAVCLLGFEIADGPIETAARWAVERGMRVVLNPAPPRGLSSAVLAAHPILTPNEGEALALGGRPDVEAAARSLAERAVAPVVVTMGARGVLVAEPGTAEVSRFAAPEVAAVDTTGAGDAAIGWAVAAAALKVTRHGARSTPRADEVHAFLAGRASGAVP